MDKNNNSMTFLLECDSESELYMKQRTIYIHDFILCM